MAIFCPLKRITRGLIPGDSNDARFHNRQLHCEPECAWHIDGSCAIAVIALNMMPVVETITADVDCAEAAAGSITEDLIRRVHRLGVSP